VKVQAIFQDGGFRPVSPPDLPEGQRVRLTVEREDIAEVEAVARGAALSRLRAGIEGMNFCSSGPLPSRDESHDRS
jgi:predicted DNA-binding antitoxin AbrB/MazE fold protein